MLTGFHKLLFYTDSTAASSSSFALHKVVRHSASLHHHFFCKAFFVSAVFTPPLERFCAAASSSSFALHKVVRHSASLQQYRLCENPFCDTPSPYCSGRCSNTGHKTAFNTKRLLLRQPSLYYAKIIYFWLQK